MILFRYLTQMTGAFFSECY